MMERVEATITIAEGQTEGEATIGYVSGLVEGIYVWGVTVATPELSLQANEPAGGSGRIIIGGMALFNGDSEAYPRVPVVDTNGDPVQFGDGFPLAEKIPVYGTLLVYISNATAGDVFNVAIYLSNSNPNGR